jgi:hypothetical protein
MATRPTDLSWNVHGEIGISESRMRRQLDFLDARTTDIDLLLLQAANYERSDGTEWSGQLGSLRDYFQNRGYHGTHTGDWARELATSSIQPHADIEAPHTRCNLLASRWPLERRSLTLKNNGDRKPRGLNYFHAVPS